MKKVDYLDWLVDKIHSSTIATIGADGHPQTRVIDMMLHDGEYVYFLTAKGKDFYSQLMEQKYVAVSATKDKVAISIRGIIENIGKDNLDLIFEKNPYMKDIYPRDTREVLEVFRIIRGQGEFFDLRNPSHIVRDYFVIGEEKQQKSGYYVGDECIRCKLCYSICPQKCIDISKKPVEIIQNNCLHCGRCAEICPKQNIKKAGG